jgi:monoamine oxidase
MKAAVEAVNYSNSAKIGVQMARRFWEEDDGIFGGAAIHNLPLGTFAYPSNGFFTRKGVLLGFYGNGNIAGLNELPIAARIEHVVAQGSKLHPQMRQEFETGYAVFWEHIEYSNGAYGTANAGLIPTLTEPDRRVYIGCAATSGNGSWMEGAFRAAWTVVDKLHRRVMA